MSANSFPIVDGTRTQANVPLRLLTGYPTTNQVLHYAYERGDHKIIEVLEKVSGHKVAGKNLCKHMYIVSANLGTVGTEALWRGNLICGV